MNPKKTNPKKKPKKKNQTPPRAVREFTSGGVVYRRGAKGLEILMISDAKQRWTIPKGHVEEGENLEQTAIREVGEETGVTNLKIRDKLDKIYFFYRRDGKLIFMTNYIFLMEAVGESDKLVKGDSEGITDVRWFPPGKALKLIEYRDIEKLFRLALKKLRHQETQRA